MVIFYFLVYIIIIAVLQNSLTLKTQTFEGYCRGKYIYRGYTGKQILEHFQFKLLLRSAPSAHVFGFKLFKFTDSVDEVINQVWKFKNRGFRPLIGANSSRKGVGSAERRVLSPNSLKSCMPCLTWLAMMRWPDLFWGVNNVLIFAHLTWEAVGGERRCWEGVSLWGCGSCLIAQTQESIICQSAFSGSELSLDDRPGVLLHFRKWH